MLTNGIMLAISEHDILKPLGVYFRPFANIINTISSVVTYALVENLRLQKKIPVYSN